ncbi:MAG TPA: pantoate--beta-alanine ligase [Acidimicrobiales bacterium]
MKLLHRIADLSAALDAERAHGRSVGLVPTMGALHAGHRSLVERAAAECEAVAVTIFVNPLQFGPGEDLDRYPRSLDADCILVDEAGADYVLAPSVEEMYGSGSLTNVAVTGAMTEVLEGASRPGHFDGVATVVAKLFAMTGRSRAYFGEKDWQQLAVVRRMTTDLSFPVEVVACPTVREPDGLARSSRNAYLNGEERERATVLHAALLAGAAAVEAGESDPSVVRARMASVVAGEPLFALDYAEVVDADTLQVPDPLTGSLRLLVAARLRSGSARLIDNLGATIPAPTNEKDA